MHTYTPHTSRGHCPRAPSVHRGKELSVPRSDVRVYFNTSILTVDLYSPVFCAIIGSIASNTTRKIGVILTTFFPAFPPPVITAHLTPPSQRATYEKINHLRQKHTTFITVRGRGRTEAGRRGTSSCGRERCCSCDAVG